MFDKLVNARWYYVTWKHRKKQHNNWFQWNGTLKRFESRDGHLDNHLVEYVAIRGPVDIDTLKQVPVSE